MSLPNFKYHPDPIGTGSVEPSENECVCCKKGRGYVYTGPVYAIEEYVDCICPWCIADGSAHRKLKASFCDEDGIGGYGEWDEVDAKVIREVAFRTPGFSGWQQEQWFTCCDDACAFLSRAGFDELANRWKEAIPVIQKNCALEGKEWEEFLRALDKDKGPTAYVFECLHCKKLGGYQDCH